MRGDDDRRTLRALVERRRDRTAVIGRGDDDGLRMALAAAGLPLAYGALGTSTARRARGRGGASAPAGRVAGLRREGAGLGLPVQATVESSPSHEHAAPDAEERNRVSLAHADHHGIFAGRHGRVDGFKGIAGVQASHGVTFESRWTERMVPVTCSG